MDPNANREEALALASKIIEHYENDRGGLKHEAARLAELVIAQDEWLSNGGFLPSAWKDVSAGSPDRR